MSASPYDWPNPATERIAALEAEVKALTKERGELQAQVELGQEYILYRVSDWLRGVGDNTHGNRLDPRINTYDRVLKMIESIEP